jgi:hypothetical protein
VAVADCRVGGLDDSPQNSRAPRSRTQRMPGRSCQARATNFWSSIAVAVLHCHTPTPYCLRRAPRPHRRRSHAHRHGLDVPPTLRLEVPDRRRRTTARPSVAALPSSGLMHTSTRWLCRGTSSSSKPATLRAPEESASLRCTAPSLDAAASEKCLATAIARSYILNCAAQRHRVDFTAAYLAPTRPLRR